MKHEFAIVYGDGIARGSVREFIRRRSAVLILGKTNRLAHVKNGSICRHFSYKSHWRIAVTWFILV